LPKWNACDHTRALDQEQAAQKRSEEAQGRKNPGIFEVTSFSFLPTTFTTLFFLAASLLLGYMQ
jgi:hypothetical protein